MKKIEVVNKEGKLIYSFNTFDEYVEYIRSDKYNDDLLTRIKKC